MDRQTPLASMQVQRADGMKQEAPPAKGGVVQQPMSLSDLCSMYSLQAFERGFSGIES